MASEIELAAEQVLGAGAIPRNNLFDPISLPSGLDTRDYLRMSQQSLADTRSRQSMLSSAMQDRLKQENVFRQLDASRREQTALQELNDLDSSDPDFQENAEMFTELAAYSPAVSRALAAKQARYAQEGAALNSVADDLARLRSTDEDIGDTLATAKNLLKSRGSNSPAYLNFRARLSRDASKKEYEEKLAFNLSRDGDKTKIAEEKAFDSGLAKLTSSVQSSLNSIQGLPPEWSSGDLIDIAYPGSVSEQVTIDRGNADNYVLDSKELNRVYGGGTLEGLYEKKLPDPKEAIVSNYGVADKEGNAVPVENIIDASRMSEDAFVNDSMFENFLEVPKDEKDSDTKYGYYKSESGSKNELSQKGERYVKGREEMLRSLHKDLNLIEDIPIKIREFFDTTKTNKNALVRELQKRRSKASETVSGLETGSEQIDAYINNKIEAGKD
jgi:hypothetical protein